VARLSRNAMPRTRGGLKRVRLLSTGQTGWYEPPPLEDDAGHGSEVGVLWWDPPPTRDHPGWIYATPDEVKEEA